MRTSLLFTSFILLFSISAKAQSPFDGNGVFDLVGQFTSSDGMQKLRSYLEEDPNTRFSETTWFSRKKGLEIGLKYGKVVRVFVHGKSPYNYGTQPFKGNHPLGISYNDSESAIISKLGQPNEKKSWGALLYYVEHKGKTYYTSIELNSDKQSIKHTFIKVDDGNHTPTIKSSNFGGKGNAIAHTDTKEKSNNGGNIEMLESFDSNKTGCITGDCNNGIGTYSWGKGNRYVGEFKGGKRHGHGTYYFSNGDVYVGEWKNNEQAGYGIYEYATKGKFQKYMGQWSSGKRQGFGFMILQTGIEQIGEWANGDYQLETNPKTGCLSGNCNSGKGTYIWKDDGSKFEGDYSSGKRNGFGVYHYGKGGSYEGNFQNGLRSGKGTYFFPNGSKYVGDWSNDKRNGYGTLYRRDGEIIKGTWKNGELIKRTN